ncbi:hypothetical protein BY458DRAFT_524043 [Sporodiniella umbellata]|nr:hypothetical protein BY458DRAFT_524043 [Sporodiniella umbellata]
MPAQKLWADKVTNETDSIFVKETHPENFSLDRASQPTSIEPAKTTFRLSSHLLHLRQKAEHQTEDQSIAFGSNTSKWSVDRNFDPFGENNHFLKSAQESNGFQSNTPRKEFYRDFFQPSLTIPANPPNQGLSGARSLGSFPVPNDWGFLEPSIGSYPDLSFMYSEEPKYSTDSPYGNTSYFGGPYPPQIEESVRQRPGFYSNYGPEEYSLQTGAYLGRNWLQPVENRYSHPLGQYQSDYRMTNNQAISKEFYPHYRYERMADTDVCFQRKVPVYHHERGYTFVNGAWFPSQQVMFQSPFVSQRPNAYRPPRVYQEDEYRNMKSMHLG